MSIILFFAEQGAAGDPFDADNTQYLVQMEKEALAGASGNSSRHLSDLVRAFYQGETGSTSRYRNDLIREWLRSETGSSSRSLSDLWRTYASQNGITGITRYNQLLKKIFD